MRLISNHQQTVLPLTVNLVCLSLSIHMSFSIQADGILCECHVTDSEVCFSPEFGNEIREDVDDGKEDFVEYVSYQGVDLMFLNTVKSKNVEERMKEIKAFKMRKGDVLLYPKSGTHWVFEMLSMLLRGTAEYVKTDINDHVLEVVNSLKDLEKMKSPRLILSHFPYRFIPEVHLDEEWKIIHVVRNPKDVLTSMYHYLSSSRNMKIPWAKYINNILQGKIKPQDGWFVFEREFEETTVSSPTNIHTIFYEDIHKNTHEELRRLAVFLKVDYNDELLEDIARKCSFQNLKGSYMSGVRPPRILMEDFDHHPVIFRKGGIGDWKNIFTVAQNERFEETLKEEMMESKLKCLSFNQCS